MTRLLFFFLVGLGIYLALKGMARKQRLREREDRRAASAAGEDMVACARCHVNVPRSETRIESGKPVCADNPRCRGPA